MDHLPYLCVMSSHQTQVCIAASLYLNVLASGQGMAYPARDYEEWARRAGFTGVRTLTDHPCEHGLTIGTKA
ncbi:hypothetical protein A6A29_09045 [Streptomyces sp. TSRI0281]|nr:hypothetical protein A6A29_09045 [Streptomyces sp. TSRI0281]